MIKDSKIIGTKIAAPFGWKKFKVGDLFDTHAPSGNGVYSSADGIKSNKIGFVRCTTSSRDHNGVPICLPRASFTEILKRGISVASNGDAGSVFYHSSEFAVLQDSYGLTLKAENDFFISDFTYLFLCSVLNKQNGLFSYTTKAVWSRYCVLEIELPVTSSNQPDFAWMEQYMKLVQEDYLKQKELSNQAEIKAYLTEGHTNSLKITDADRQFLRDFEKLPRREFKVGELFDVKSTRALNFNELESSGDYPYVVRSAERNGIRDYMIGPLDFLNEGNCITLGIDTASYFYQSCDYFFAGVKVKALYLKTYKLNMNIALYLISVLSKQVSGYGYVGGKSFSVQEFSSEYLELPALSDSQVDFESIEKYMQIQSKPLINKVAEMLVPAGATN